MGIPMQQMKNFWDLCQKNVKMTFALPERHEGVGCCYIPEDYAARFQSLQQLGIKIYASQRVRSSLEYISAKGSQ